MLSVGDLIHHRYRIIREIGRGGMGAVYEAEDERLRVRVALKQTLVGGSDLVRAFEREAHLLARLRHAALPVVSDYFTEEHGSFLVMQYIAGDDLGTLLMRQPQGRFDEATVLAWGDQLLAALDYLHRQEPPIIHRDIKPANLKLTPDNQLILLDFGLAKGATLQQTAVASNVSIFGYTPNYAPLEQVQAQGTTAQSDVYAVGATLYHLLTGTVPATTLTRLEARARGQPDPLAPAHHSNPAVSESVSMALAAMLGLLPEERPVSAAAARELLHTAQQGVVPVLPPTAAVPPLPYEPTAAAPLGTAGVPPTAAAPPLPYEPTAAAPSPAYEPTAAAPSPVYAPTATTPPPTTQAGGNRAWLWVLGGVVVVLLLLGVFGLGWAMSLGGTTATSDTPATTTPADGAGGGAGGGDPAVGGDATPTSEATPEPEPTAEATPEPEPTATLVPTTPPEPTAPPQPAPNFQTILTFDGFIAVRAGASTDTAEVTRLNPGTALYCSEQVQGQYLGPGYTEASGKFIPASSSWYFCPSVGGYIFAPLLDPL